MKTISTLALFLVISTAQSQTVNRYTNLTASSYRSLNQSDLHMKAKATSNSITNDIIHLYGSIDKIVENNPSLFLLQKLSESVLIIDSIVSEEWISINEAKSRVSKAYKVYNKAIKLERKRLKVLDDFNQFENIILENFNKQIFYNKQYKKDFNEILKELRKHDKKKSLKGHKELKKELKEIKNKYKQLQKEYTGYYY